MPTGFDGIFSLRCSFAKKKKMANRDHEIPEEPKDIEAFGYNPGVKERRTAMHSPNHQDTRKNILLPKGGSGSSGQLRSDFTCAGVTKGEAEKSKSFAEENFIKGEIK